MIHEFKNGHWVPGPSHCDGRHRFPDHPVPGMFFNDVTGVTGRSAETLHEGLADLLMMEGALNDILPRAFNLTALMHRIVAASPRGGALPPRLMAEVVVAPDESLRVMPKAPWPRDLAEELGQFALSLVRANGQMAYLRRQPWFKAGRHEVVLVVESEFDRPLTNLTWHKDTSGDALFSNLVFHNNPGMPATEWTPDLQPMPLDKRELLEKNWPAPLLAEIDAVRAALVQEGSEAQEIGGGTLETDGVISWVDELNWHSSPTLAHRSRWSAATVAGVMGRDEYTAGTYDLMAHMAQTPGSHLAGWMAANGLAIEDLSIDVAGTLWTSARQDAGYRPLLDAIQQDARDIDWSVQPTQTGYAMGLIDNMPEGNEQEILTQPSGIGARPRANSANMEDLASNPASYQRRNFIQIIVAVRPRR